MGLSSVLSCCAVFGSVDSFRFSSGVYHGRAGGRHAEGRQIADAAVVDEMQGLTQNRGRILLERSAGSLSKLAKLSLGSSMEIC
jgi:hypothetical protein